MPAYAPTNKMILQASTSAAATTQCYWPLCMGSQHAIYAPLDVAPYQHIHISGPQAVEMSQWVEACGCSATLCS